MNQNPGHKHKHHAHGQTNDHASHDGPERGLPVSRDPNGKPSETGGDRKNGENTRERETIVLRRIEIFLTILLVLVGGIYSWVSYAQLRAIERTQTLTNAAFKTGERAYVVIDHIILTQPLRAGSEVLAEVRFKNSGRTPAKNLTVMYSISFGNNVTADLAQLRQHLKEAPSVAVLGQGVVASAQVQTQGTTLNQVGLESIETQKVNLWVWGIVEYEDIFGRKWQTGFCGFYKPQIEGPARLSLFACDKGNFAD